MDRIASLLFWQDNMHYKRGQLVLLLREWRYDGSSNSDECSWSSIYRENLLLRKVFRWCQGRHVRFKNRKLIIYEYFSASQRVVIPTIPLSSQKRSSQRAKTIRETLSPSRNVNAAGERITKSASFIKRRFGRISSATSARTIRPSGARRIHSQPKTCRKLNCPSLSSPRSTATSLVKF